jgi:hypothetical protein
MLTTETSELLVGVLAVSALAILSLWRLLLWVRNAPVHPDPWDEATETAVRQDNAVLVCHHCLSEVAPGQWFCEHCSCAVGPYNNLMPFISVFSEGEVFRNGALDKVRRSPVTVIGYVLYSVTQFLIFAPIYWYFLFRNLRRCKTGGIESDSLGGGG